MIQQTTINITVADTEEVDGAETQAENSDFPLNGHLEAIKVDHSAGAVTSDLTVTCGGLTLLSKADSVTDATFFPRAALALNSDASALSFYDKIPLDGYVTATIAQANKDQTCAVTIFWDDGRS